MKELLPPTLAFLLLAVSVALGLLLPVLGPLPGPLRALGLVPVTAGLLLTQSSHRLFTATGTNLNTFEEPTRLVTAGTFAHTRNPMYLGLLLVLAGAALITGSLSAWVAPVGFLLAASWHYIPYEEALLAAKFGAEYEEYRQSVPRWLGRHKRTRRSQMAPQ